MSPKGNVCAVCGQAYEPRALFCPKDGTPLGAAELPRGADPYLGVEILGQIRIEQLIGIGSMGRVYRAFQSGIDRHVAVKILHRELSANEVLVARFHREAKIASRLSHPHVVQVLMTGQLPAGGPGEGAMYQIMEYLDGLSLRSALAAGDGALPLPRALHIILQVCDAVGEGHAQGVIHRDLKPDNVMLVRRGHDADFVKVLDFGIARLTWSDTPSVTQAGLVFGTARYISPEGASGKPVGPAADVYAITTILYQALAGRPPFEGESSVALLVKHTNETPPPLTSISRARYVPAPLEAVMMQNLAKEPERRAPDARALGVAIVAAARASGLSADELLPRSTLFDATANERPAPFVSKERTRQLDFGAGLEAIRAQIAQAVRSPLGESGGGTCSEGREAPASKCAAAPLPQKLSQEPPAPVEEFASLPETQSTSPSQPQSTVGATPRSGVAPVGPNESAARGEGENRRPTGTVLSEEAPPIDRTIDDATPMPPSSAGAARANGVAAIPPNGVVGEARLSGYGFASSPAAGTPSPASIPANRLPSTPDASAPRANAVFAGSYAAQVPGAHSPSVPGVYGPPLVPTPCAPPQRSLQARLGIVLLVAVCFLVGAALAIVGVNHWRILAHRDADDVPLEMDGGLEPNDLPSSRPGLSPLGSLTESATTPSSSTGSPATTQLPPVTQHPTTGRPTRFPGRQPSPVSTISRPPPRATGHPAPAQGSEPADAGSSSAGPRWL